ncbi:MAG: hypothetical protein Q9220_004554 [cf. Caloplaca sp. 1 TL-2023]
MSLKRKRQHDHESSKENEQPIFNDAVISTALNGDQLPETPSKRRRGRPPGSANKPKSTPKSGTPRDVPSSKLKGKRLFETPVKAKFNDPNKTGTSNVLNADRSARRKSAKTLIGRSIATDDNQEGDLDEEDDLAKRIWDAEEQGGDDISASSDEEPNPHADAPVIPSKIGRKGPRRKRTPTPPQDLPPYEQYFFQNRPGNTKTSNNTFSSLSLLSHEQYHHYISAYKDPHASSYAFLHSLHSRSFPQWRFELSQSFSICLYGYGSKRHLTASFASYLHSQTSSSPPKIVMTNGYIPSLTIRQLLTTVAAAVWDCPASSLPKIGTQPRDILDSILRHLKASPPSYPIYLIINSLDAPPLRRAPIPALLAHLVVSSSPHIRLLATCDTPNFPLLWDPNLREQYNWLFHDTTTFVSYAGAEIEDVVEEVNELLGRSGRRIKGKEGVGFVLRSLPENARGLYRVLIAELLASEEGGLGAEGGGDHDDVVGDEHAEDDEDDQLANGTPRHEPRRGNKGAAAVGSGGACIEYKTLYQKVVEEFICSSEMGFRQLLKEFHDHQMVTSRRDVTGAEMLGVPFRQDEMEAILEDLVE